MKQLHVAIALILMAQTCAAENAPPENGPSAIQQAYVASAGIKKVLRIGLVDCIAYALRKSNDIRISKIEPKVADDRVRVARSAFEPTLSADYTLHDSTEKSSNIFYPDDSRLRDITYGAGISGKLVTGTNYRADFLNQRYKSNSDIQTLNPYYASEPIIAVTQPLLRGAGIAVNRADITIAQNNKKQTEEAFVNTVIDTISQTKSTYFNYNYALEANAIATRYLQSARLLFEINRARYAKGLTSSVDLLEAEAAVAEREKLLLDAEYAIKTAEDRLKYITNIVEDPSFWNADIQMIDTPEFRVEAIDLVKCINDAFIYRPDYKAKKIDLKNRDIRIMVNKNALFPTLDVVGSFGLNGLGDSLGNGFENIHWRYQDWIVGGKLTIPWGMGDRARYDQAKLEKARALLELEKLEQTIILQVRDRVREVDIQFRQEKAARIAKEKEGENYAAQSERFAAGQVSTHDMLDYQYKLSKSELDYSKALIDYNIALINLDKEVGLTLVKNNIKIEQCGGDM